MIIDKHQDEISTLEANYTLVLQSSNHEPYICELSFAQLQAPEILVK